MDPIDSHGVNAVLDQLRRLGERHRE
jgi:hypothetical protein